MLSEEAEEREKLAYHTDAMQHFRNLYVEQLFLEQLICEINWFNFECRCRTWCAPWTESDADFIVELLGVVNEEHCTDRTIFYMGQLRDATQIHGEILRNELALIKQERSQAYDLARAPYDWAPGGHLYEKLLREGLSAQTYERWRSSNQKAGTDAGSGPTATHA